MYCFVGGITYGITPVWGTWYDPPTRVGIFSSTPHSVNNEAPHIFACKHGIALLKYP